MINPDDYHPLLQFGCKLILKHPSVACYLSQANFLLSLFFDTEDGGEVSLRNIG
jgi:hypothetical protein